MSDLRLLPSHLHLTHHLAHHLAHYLAHHLAYLTLLTLLTLLTSPTTSPPPHLVRTYLVSSYPALGKPI